MRARANMFGGSFARAFTGAADLPSILVSWIKPASALILKPAYCGVCEALAWELEITGMRFV